MIYFRKTNIECLTIHFPEDTHIRFENFLNKYIGVTGVHRSVKKYDFSHSVEYNYIPEPPSKFRIEMFIKIMIHVEDSLIDSETLTCYGSYEVEGGCEKDSDLTANTILVDMYNKMMDFLPCSSMMDNLPYMSLRDNLRIKINDNRAVLVTNCNRMKETREVAENEISIPTMD